MFFLSFAIGRRMDMKWHGSLLTMARHRQTQQDAKQTETKLLFMFLFERLNTFEHEINKNKKEPTQGMLWRASRYTSVYADKQAYRIDINISPVSYPA